MFEFVSIHWQSIALVFALVCLALLAANMGYREQVEIIAYRLVCKAEKEILGSKRGQEKKAQVIKWLHEQLPPVAKLFVTEKDIDQAIEFAVQKMKAYLE